MKGLTRRQLLRGTAGAGASMTILAACGQRTARPVSREPVVTVTFEPWAINGYLSTSLAKIYQQVLAPFEAANTSIKVQIIPENALGYENGVIAASLAGKGPDILYETQFGAFLENDLLLPLNDYVKKDGVDTSIWSAGQVNDFTLEGQLYGIPVYQGSVVFALNLDVFDSSGVPYPEETWTYQDFVTLCERLTVSSSTNPHSGGMVFFSKDGTGGSISWLFKAFGGNQMNATGTQSTISTMQGIAASQWLYKDLVWRNIIGSGFGPAQLPAGASAMVPVGTWMLVQLAETIGNTKWTFFPVPTYPAGRATFGNSDFYGINSLSPHPEQAWEVLKWISTEKPWQEAMMKLLLAPPAMSSLWPEWESTIVQAAPNFANKGLRWFQDAAVKGYAYPQEFYSFGDTEAEAILGDYLSELWQQQMTSVTTAFQQADQNINAVFAANASFLKQVQVASAELAQAAKAKNPAPFPAPPTMGAGTAPTSATALVQQPTAAGGSWTITGDGAGIGSTTDIFVFASEPFTGDAGTFTCRIDGLYNLSCPSLSPYAQVGLMARSDLSSDAACILVYATAGKGTGVMVRNEPTLPMTEYDAPATGSKIGLISAPYLTAATMPAGTTSNDLTAPIWLRLVRTAGRWQPYTSVNGKTWTVTGPSFEPLMAGCWVGLFACAANASFSDKGQIKTVLTPLDFAPTNFSFVGGAG